MSAALLTCYLSVFCLYLQIGEVASANLNLLGIPLNLPVNADLLAQPQCIKSQTIVNGVQGVCKNALIFEDDFTKKNINQKKWTIEHRLPNAEGPDYEFVSYQNKDDTVYQRNGKIHLKPIAITNDDDVYGELDLTIGCTSSLPNECKRSQQSAFILPPVKSGKITSKFSFQYGRVEIVAKLPKGDWIYPELYLEPKDEFYGPGYSSGRMWIAYTRGNSHLVNGNGTDFGSHQLWGGAVLGAKEPDRFCAVRSKYSTNGKWTNKPRTFTLIWTPDDIAVFADAEEYGRVAPDDNGFASCAKTTIRNNRKTWNHKMAPFDREFVISLGVGVGGRNDFPDNTVSMKVKKPWGNQEVKAAKKFFDSRTDWMTTWDNEGSELKVDSVKVYAV